MTDAIAKAIADSQRSLLACKAAVSSQLSDTLVSQGPGGQFTHRPDLNNAAEALRHFRGWVYTSVRPIATRIAAQPIHVGRSSGSFKIGTKSPDGFTPTSDHELVRILNDPNPLMTAWSLIFSTVASLECTGRALWVFSGKEGKRTLWPIPVPWIRRFEGTERYTQIVIQPPHSGEEIPIDADATVLFSYPSPADPHGVCSPLMAAAGAIDSDECQIASQASVFRKGVHPSIVLTVGSNPHPDFPAGSRGGAGGFRPRLNDAQTRQIIDAVLKRYGSYANDGAPLILDGLIEDAKNLSTLPREMDFLQSGQMVRERIMMAFGTSPIISGLVEGSNRASSDAADRHFCDYTVNPKITLLSQTLSSWLRYTFKDERLAVWIEPCVSHDSEMALKWATLLAQYGSVTGDELRERSPLGLKAKGFPDPVTPGKTQAEQSMDDATIALAKATDEISPSRQAEKLLAEIGGDRHRNRIFAS